MIIQRFLVTLCSKDVEQSKDFYTTMFSFNVNFSSDWFVQLVTANGNMELGIILEGHDVVPPNIKSGTNANYLTFVVEDVDCANEKALSLGYNVIEVPKDTIYRQKRMLVTAPEGTVCDISSLSTDNQRA